MTPDLHYSNTSFVCSYTNRHARPKRSDSVSRKKNNETLSSKEYGIQANGGRRVASAKRKQQAKKETKASS